MKWTRSETLGLASQKCPACRGIGLPNINDEAAVPCACVSRAIFRACLEKFKSVAGKEKSVTHVSVDTYTFGNRGGYVWGRKDEEFMADFWLIAKRTLSALEWKVFSFRYLLGADWAMCAQRLGMERGVFYRHLCKVEEKLGRAFRETEPYGLFPFDEYYGWGGRRNVARATTVKLRTDEDRRPVNPPMAA